MGIGLAVLLLLGTPAWADMVGELNAIRSNGCKGEPGVSSPLRENRDLNLAARQWADGKSLEAALEPAGHRVVRAVSLHVTAREKEPGLLELIRRNFCDALLDPAFKEVGLFQRGDAAWVILVQPAAALTPQDAGAVRQQVLALVNEARAKPRSCGPARFEAVPPVKLSAMLNHAALIHSEDMSIGRFIAHQGSDGSKVADRVTRTGYRWRAVGENIAAGPDNAEALVRGWLRSPGHCATIMGPAYTEMGLAFVTNFDSAARIYWTLVFAAPQ